MLDPQTAPELNGVPCTGQIMKTGRGGAACEDCHFSAWGAGDVKYVLEEWMVDIGARVHLCPACAIKRGLPPGYFHKNVNDMRECPNVEPHSESDAGESESESESDSDDERKCRNCNVTSTSQYPAGASQNRGLLEVTWPSGDLMILCAKCWIDSTLEAVSRSIDASPSTAGILEIKREVEQSIETTADDSVLNIASSTTRDFNPRGIKREIGFDAGESPQSKKPATIALAKRESPALVTAVIVNGEDNN